MITKKNADFNPNPRYFPPKVPSARIRKKIKYALPEEERTVNNIFAAIYDIIKYKNYVTFMEIWEAASVLAGEDIPDKVTNYVKRFIDVLEFDPETVVNDNFVKSMLLKNLNNVK